VCVNYVNFFLVLSLLKFAAGLLAYSVSKKQSEGTGCKYECIDVSIYLMSYTGGKDSVSETISFCSFKLILSQFRWARLPCCILALHSVVSVTLEYGRLLQ
jgi:hypothetical protein